MTQQQPDAVALRGIVKRFPGVIANDNVDLTVAPGEIHAVMGENGAGKSTLMSILYGLSQPDSGAIEVGGRPVSFSSAADAIDAGIGMVQQGFALFDTLSVTDNVIFGAEPTRRGLLDRRAARTAVAALIERHGLRLRPTDRVGDLPVGVRQQVEILKLLYRAARVLILDEPTAVLTPAETDRLFDVLRGLAAEGRTILFVSHKLHEVLALSDNVTVLRDGRVTLRSATADTDRAALAAAMTGRDVELDKIYPVGAPGEVVLSVRGLTMHGHPALDDVSLEVRAGEIVGIAGVAGNGQTELVAAIAGLRRPAAGTITIAVRDAGSVAAGRGDAGPVGGRGDAGSVVGGGDAESEVEGCGDAGSVVDGGDAESVMGGCDAGSVAGGRSDAGPVVGGGDAGSVAESRSDAGSVVGGGDVGSEVGGRDTGSVVGGRGDAELVVGGRDAGAVGSREAGSVVGAGDGGVVAAGVRDLSELSVRGRRAAGLAHIPEDRAAVGSAPSARLVDNLAVGFQRRLARRGFLRPRAIREHGAAIIERFGVRAAGPDVLMRTLSGGNQQKAILGRELAHDAPVLLVEQPTRGVDIGAVVQIHQRLIEYRDAGHAVLLVSAELSEIRALADRVLVMYEGRVVASFTKDEATYEALGLAMAGVTS